MALLNPTKKSYSLEALLRSVKERLDGASDRAESILRAPSLATLKNLSRSGYLQTAKTLTAAVDLVLLHLQARSGFYAERASNERVSFKKPALANKPETNDTPRAHQPLTVEPSPVSSDAQPLEFLTTLKTLTDAVERIEKRLTMLERSVSTSVTGQLAGIHPAVLASVEQLTATQRHLMVAHDRELTALRQGGAGGGRMSDGPSALDAQRILAQLSHLRDQVGRLATSP